MKTGTKALVAMVAAVFAGVAAAPIPTADASLTFSYTQSQSSETAQTASGGTGTIDFTGSLTTPTPCYTLTATHQQRGSRIILTVTATQTGNFCIQVITYNNYEGQISGLDAGTYTFEVQHRTGTGPAQTVFSEQVTVQ